MSKSVFIPDDTMINHRTAEFFAYFDLEDGQAKPYDCDEAAMLKKKGKQLLLLSFEEDLCPLSKVLNEYFFDRGIEHPKSKDRISYLHEVGRYYDFLDFKSECIKHAYTEWCQKNLKIKE